MARRSAVSVVGPFAEIGGGIMPILDEIDVRTREVLDWSGIHLLHFNGSSCSQKVRIFLNLKGIDWQPHHIDLAQRENATEWFMGINPRGLVPVLVHDGSVIIESNDILEYLEEHFPSPVLIPADQRAQMHELLRAEDDLHLDLRSLSMRYLFNAKGAMRTPEDLSAYQRTGSGTVGGRIDNEKQKQVEFFKNMAENGGITDSQIRQAAIRFRRALDQLESRLTDAPYLLGEHITVLDIAWFIYAARLNMTGYPIAKLHPKVGAWYDGLFGRPEFAKEVALPPPLIAMRDAMHLEQAKNNQTLIEVAGF